MKQKHYLHYVHFEIGRGLKPLPSLACMLQTSLVATSIAMSSRLLATSSRLLATSSRLLATSSRLLVPVGNGCYIAP